MGIHVPIVSFLIRKIPQFQVITYNWGFKVVFISRTCFPDNEVVYIYFFLFFQLQNLPYVALSCFINGYQK